VSTLKIKSRLIGRLRKQRRNTVEITRSEFLSVVNMTIDAYYGGDADFLRAELLPVAEKMPRFPLGTWLHSERGCGCVVGEYLVASREVGEVQEINEAIRKTRKGSLDRRRAIIAAFKSSSVEELLMTRNNGRLLAEFGQDIDANVRDYIRGRLEDGVYATDVASVEIVKDPVAA
jgi:hypothetical protein